MVNHKRNVRWNMFFHYSNIAYSVLIGIVLVPIYLRFIPNSIYGYWMASGSILTWVSVVDPGFGLVVQQKVGYHYGAKDIHKVGMYISSGFLWTSFILIPLVLVGIFVYSNFTYWLDITDVLTINSLKSAFLLSLIGMLFTFFSYTITSVNQGLQSSLGIGLIFTFANLSGIAMTIWLLYAGFGVVGLGYSLLWRGIWMFFGNLGYLIRRIKKEQIPWIYSSTVVREMRHLISFNFLGRIAEVTNGQVASFFITKILGPINTIVYRFMLTIPENTKLLTVRPAIALLPSVIHLLGEGNLIKIQEVFLRLIRYMVWASGLILVGFITLNDSFISLWAGHQYYGGIALNIILVVWVIISSFTNSFASITFALGNIKRNNIVTFIQACIYLPCLFVGLHYFGLLGAGLALIVAELALPVWYFPKVLAEKIKLSKDIGKDLLKEALTVLGIVIILLICFYTWQQKISNWLYFAEVCFVIVTLYVFLLSILSHSFRDLIFTTGAQIKNYKRKKSINL